jgi:hypothetical protein
MCFVLVNSYNGGAMTMISEEAVSFSSIGEVIPGYLDSGLEAQDPK